MRASELVTIFKMHPDTPVVVLDKINELLNQLNCDCIMNEISIESISLIKEEMEKMKELKTHIFSVYPELAV